MLMCMQAETSDKEEDYAFAAEASSSAQEPATADTHTEVLAAVFASFHAVWLLMHT